MMQVENDMAARAFRRYVGYKKRAERSATDILSGAFILSGIIFWAVAFWQLLQPPSILSLQAIQALVLAFVTSVAAPLLWSALVPSTPAGQLLQRTQWATIGFVVSTAAAVFLSYVQYWLLASWMVSQPGIAENGFAPMLAVAMLIAFILIPALGWVKVPFHTMLDQIQQAHEIRKLDLMHRSELALLKNRELWAIQKAAIGYANLLPHEQAYVFDTLEGLFRLAGDRQREIVRMLGVQADLEGEYAVVQDQDMVDQLRRVQAELNSREITIRPRPALDVTGSAAGGRGPHQDAIPVQPPPRPAAAAPAAAPPQSAAVSRSQPQFAAEYEAARGKLTGVWSSADLGAAIGKSPRSALERIYAWERQGLVGREADGKGSYYFTESEAA